MNPDTNYMADNDVAILAEAAEIQADKARMARASNAADDKIDRLKMVRDKVFPKAEPKKFDGAVANSSFTKGR